MEENKKNIPLHVAIIPDGNRRWARARGLSAPEGHEAGAKNFEELIKYSNKIGISCVTVWGSSLDNLKKRPLVEKRALFEIYKKYFRRMIDGDEIYKNEVKINVIGRWERELPGAVKALMHEAIEKTKHYKKRMFNFMLAYSGTDEMIYAMQKIKDGYPKGTKVTPKMIKENMMTKDLPPVDLLIRTGGEPHNSTGFMMWDVAEAQYFFSPELFPDFTVKKYEEALKDYARRARRFGK